MTTSLLILLLVAAAPEETLAAKSARAQQAYDAGDFAGCQTQYESLGSAPEWSHPARALASAACCAARAGKPDDAFALLARMLPLASPEEAEQTLDDSDFATLKTDRRWATHRRAVAEVSKKNAVAPPLQKIIDADHAERQGGPFKKGLIERDAARRVATEKLIAQGTLKSAADYRAAALVFQHGQTVDEGARAHALAIKAVALEPSCASRHMVAITEDRWLMRQGLPQKYGTQSTCAPGTQPMVCTRYKVDPSITDEQRVALCTPPLTEL